MEVRRFLCRRATVIKLLFGVGLEIHTAMSCNGRFLKVLGRWADGKCRFRNVLAVGIGGYIRAYISVTDNDVAEDEVATETTTW